MSKAQLKVTLILLGILAGLFLITFFIMVFSSSTWIKLASLFPFIGAYFLVFIEGWFAQKYYFKLKKDEKYGK